MLVVPLTSAAAPDAGGSDWETPLSRAEQFHALVGDVLDSEKWVQTQEDMEALEAQYREILAQPSSLTAADVKAIYGALARGEEVEQYRLLEFALYMRDNQAALPAIETPLAGAAIDYVQETVDEVQEQQVNVGVNTAWGNDVWSELVVPETLAYVTAGAVHSPIFLDVNDVDLFLDFGVLGCSRGIICIRIVTDLALGLALDFHKTTDQVLLHTGLVIDIGLEIVGYFCFFGICLPIIVPFIAFPNVAIAEDADYVHTCPLNNCQVADRATNSDILQVVYDALGSVGRMRGQEWTADTVEGGTPAAGQVSGGTPGLADLHAVAPEPTYYGLQANGDVTGAANDALANYPAGTDPEADRRVGGVHTRTRGDSSLPADNTGLTAVFDKTSFRNLDFDIWTVRWNNVGLGDANAAGVSGSIGEMVYDAPGGSLLHGAGALWTWDMSLDDPIA